MSGWTAADVRRVTSQHAVAKPSKYKAVRTVCDGITFDSKKEATRFQELRLLERAGQISQLLRQPVYRLVVHRFAADGGGMITIGKYIGDFQYREAGHTIVEDVKGVRTPVYRLKKKFVEALYGISIRET